MNQKKSSLKERYPNIELNLAKKSIVGNRKIALEIFLLFSAAFFLIQGIFVLTDSIRNTLLEQRMERYGEWGYSLPGNFQSHLSKAAGQSGIVTVVGTMRTSNSERSVPIGYFDQRALELSRITLVEGRLPEKSGEIAVEMETLIRMGLPYDAGTELELNIDVLQKVKGLPDTYVTPQKTFHYTVCGVIKSYSSGWATAGKQNIPQAIVTPDTEEMVLEAFRSDGWSTIDIIFQKYTLFKLMHGYNSLSLAKFLEDTGIPSDGMVANTKTYPENPYSVLDGVLQLLYLACSLIAWCLLLLTVNKTISLQRSSLQQLAFLGAGQGQLRRILLWQCLLYTASALPCGLLVGIAAGSCLITVGTAITGAQIRLSITGTGVLLSLLTGLAVTGVGSAVPILFSRKLYSENGKRSFAHKRIRKKSKNYRRDHLPYGVLTAKTFLGAFGRSFLIIVSSGIYLAVIFQIIFQITSSVSSYQYALDFEADYKMMGVNLTESDLEDLKRVPGMEDVIAVKESMNFYLCPGLHEPDPYFTAVKQREEAFLPRPGIETDEISTTIVGLNESERNNTMLREEFGLTEAELTSFYRGEFICLFLPELYVAENPGETMAQIYEGYFADPVPLIRSSSLQKGDAVRLSYVTVKRDNQGKIEEVLRESREYKIGAIADIYSFFASHRENVSTSTYGIVMSGILLEDFSTYPNGSRYQTIWLKTNDDATYESTDKVVSALAAKEKTNYFVNTRLLQEERFAKMLTDVSGLLFVMILLTLLLVLILYHLFTLETEHMKSRLSLLECLGIRRRTLWNMYIGRGITTGLLCGGTAFLGYLVMLLIQAEKEATSGIYSLFVMVFRRIQMTNWQIAGITTLLFMIILILLSCNPVRKILGRSAAENIS